MSQEARDIDNDHVLHTFFHHRLDVGPIRLTSITHAFNYRIAVLRDGAKLAARVGRSRRAAWQILDDVDIPWGHQMAAMFQIVCALALEVSAVLLELGQLKGVSPNVTLACEPWRRMNHDDGGGECLSSDRTGAYVHEIVLVTSSRDLISDSGELPDAEIGPAMTGLHTRWPCVWGRFHMCPICPELTAGCSWPCKSSGRQVCWGCLIG